MPDQKQPIPVDLAMRVSQKAVQYARENMARRGWTDRSQQAILPSPELGKVGIRTTAKHLVYQNKGIRPFLMTALEGKTVPINGRFFRVSGVGLPGMGYQNRKHNPVKGPVWREQRWKHPGIHPQRFLENSISRAIMEMRPEVQQEMIRRIRNGEA